MLGRYRDKKVDSKERETPKRERSRTKRRECERYQRAQDGETQGREWNVPETRV